MARRRANKKGELRQEFDPAIDIGKLSEHPENPRLGDDDVVRESIDELGFFGAVLVQKSTGYVLAGNTRLRVERDKGSVIIPGFWLDVDDETAKRIMLIDNRASDMAFYDDDKLRGVLTSMIESSRGLAGTGYDDSAYELLLSQGSGNVRQGLTPGDRRDDYEASDIRSIILPYDRVAYDEIIDALARLRTHFDVETNAEVFLTLARNEVSTLPAEEPEPEEG